jgi:hypothetical protein
LKKDSSTFDIFLSYSDNDRSWARSLFTALTKEGYKVFFDKEAVKSSDNLWEKIYSGLSSSRYIVFVISKNGISSDWEQMEVIAQIWFELLEKKKKSFIISLSDSRIPALIKSSKHINGQEDTDVDDIVDELSSLVKPEKKSKGSAKKLSGQELIDFVQKSLKIKLKFDFLLPSTEKEKIEPLYEQFTYSEHSIFLDKNKLNTYLSYWGYKGLKSFEPAIFNNYSKVSVNFVHAQFSKKLLFEVSLPKPSIFKDIKSIKHTVWAAELLLLLEHHLDFVAEIIENLIEKSSEYTNDDGGWKDFLHPTRQSSLITSVYIFSLFSKLCNHEELIDIPVRLHDKVTQLLEQTEKFILAQWEERKWQFSNLHWQISAINIFIHYAQYSTNKTKLKAISDILFNFLTKDGHLVNPLVGIEFFLSEYILSARLAYALKISGRMTKKNAKFNSLVERLLNEYSNSEAMAPHDIFFLSELFKNLS